VCVQEDVTSAGQGEKEGLIPVASKPIFYPILVKEEEEVIHSVIKFSGYQPYQVVKRRKKPSFCLFTT
jgi:hypothetical protein